MNTNTIRAASITDAAAIAGIYNHYITNTTITFEEAAVDEHEMAARIAETQNADLPWLVAESAGCVIGYAYASKWKGRCAYRYSVESSVYVAAAHVGKKAGSQLYEALFEFLGKRGMHAVIAGIALPNPASIALHDKFGMTQVAHFREVGFKFKRWIDVGYWQRLL